MRIYLEVTRYMIPAKGLDLADRCEVFPKRSQSVPIPILDRSKSMRIAVTFLPFSRLHAVACFHARRSLHGSCGAKMSKSLRNHCLWLRINIFYTPASLFEHASMEAFCRKLIAIT